MWGKTRGGIVVAFICWAGAAGAGDGLLGSLGHAGGKVYAPVYGEAQPPVGFLDFCSRESAQCLPVKARGGEVRLTPDRWRQLNEVNLLANKKVAPASDVDVYGLPEYWAFPADAGDCEDYVLLKKRRLEALGFSPDTLLITVVLDERGEGHAVLMVRTQAGDFVLDNRRDEIKRWGETRYQYLKRQSAENPRKWLALTPRSAPDSGAIAGN